MDEVKCPQVCSSAFIVKKREPSLLTDIRSVVQSLILLFHGLLTLTGCVRGLTVCCILLETVCVVYACESLLQCY